MNLRAYRFACAESTAEPKAYKKAINNENSKIIPIERIKNVMTTAVVIQETVEQTAEKDRIKNLSGEAVAVMLRASKLFVEEVAARVLGSRR